MQDATVTSTMRDDRVTLQQHVNHLQRLNEELLTTITQLRSDNRQLQERLDWLVRQHFGRRSERINPDQPLLFDEPEAETPPLVPEPAPEDNGSTKRRGHGRRPKPKDLVRQREVLQLTEAEKNCPCCGSQRVCIGTGEVTELYDYTPASVFIQEFERPTFICRRCEQQGLNIQAIQPALPPQPIPKSTAAAGLLAHVFVSKYCDHLPLYRLESILGRLGWEVKRSTLCDQMMKCAELLRPLYELMCQRVKSSFALHTDDTHLTLLDPRRTAHAWVYVGDSMNPYTVFDLSPGRQQEYPEKFLKGYQSYVHADGYAGYNPIYAAGAKHVGCWMHARRYYFEAKDSDTLRAHEALARIRSLYAIETEAKQTKPEPITGDALQELRRQRAGPILQSFADWLAEEVPKVPPKSKIAEALTYSINQWQSLNRYLDDGRLTIDNNPAEQAIRPLALGRRNWLHIAGDGGLPSAAVLLSIAASAKRHQVNPWTYVKHLLSSLAARQLNAHLADLLPDVWANAATNAK